VQAVIADILSGKPEAFRVIIREYGDDLLRIAYHFVHDWDDAQDVVQTTLIACYRNLRRYDATRPFRPWLYRIHLNVCRSAARQRKRAAQHVPLSEAADRSQAEQPIGDEALIWTQIERLSSKQKAAFIMIEIENWSSREAAEALGCAESTLRVHLARAKQNLRNYLSQYGFGDEEAR